MKIGFQTPCEAILLGLHLLLQVILTWGLYADRARFHQAARQSIVGWSRPFGGKTDGGSDVVPQTHKESLKK